MYECMDYVNYITMPKLEVSTYGTCIWLVFAVCNTNNTMHRYDVEQDALSFTKDFEITNNNRRTFI